MTGSRHKRSTFPLLPHRPRRTTALSAVAMAACVSLAAGCGTVPGFAGAADDEIKVMTWAPQKTGATNKPGMPAMASAVVRWLNSRGGIGGRKLKLITCNDHNTSVGAANCAQRAADENVVAVVGSYSQFGDSYFAPLEGAAIPYIGGYGASNVEFTSPVSYPVNGGQLTLLAGLGEALAESCGPVTLVRPDSIAGDQLPQLLDSGLRAGGHAKAIDQLAAEDLTAYDEQSKKALGSASSDSAKTGCVVPELGGRTATFMDSFQRARQDYPTVKTAAEVGSVDQTVINSTGGASGPYEGSYITGWYPVASDPHWDEMKKVISKEAFGDNRIDPADAGVQTTWIAYKVLTAVLEKIGDGEVTSDSVRRTLNDGLKVSTGGLTPTLTWPYQGKLAAAGFSRLVNADVNVQTVKGGLLQSANKNALDMTEILANADLS
ncbi:ABC transporter substrate-binding protein [Streptomyces arenae]|uniref:ABC transporter substrate-binding protein n=1 Tax=Streptomyces arenae TaxID=29301 RepID=UPI002658C7C4|nr:ABC transporter substrate-binding protein [Streptomyces arenae]MCG7210527.1 ABC transporter substrate-binding protein [Streptomyces arenae]